MRTSRLSRFSALCLLSIAFFYAACSSKPKTDPVTASAAPGPAPTDSATVAIPAAAEDTTVTAAVIPTPAAGSTNDLPERSLSENKIGTQLIYISESITAQKLPYIVGGPLLQDCSGIFLRITDSIRTRIPVLADKSKYTFPDPNIQRSSRNIARWYHDHNNLHIVENGKADANRIRPGSVMFFSNTDQQYSNMDIELLAGDSNKKGVIMHIATVVSVEKDTAGNVAKYTMMHGRNTKYPASPSGGNCDCGGSTAKQHELFPFGNWNQQWVAVANIETPVQ